MFVAEFCFKSSSVVEIHENISLVATRDLSISTIVKIKGFGVSTRNCQQTIKKI
jgi:hypothetical protein